MLRWALIFLVLSIVAGLLGFTSIAVAAASIAQIIFYVFLLLFVITLIAGILAGRRPPRL